MPSNALEQALSQIERLEALNPWVAALAGVAALIIIAFVANAIAKLIVVRLVMHGIARSPFRDEAHEVASLVTHLAHVVPALIVSEGIGFVPYLPAWLVSFVGHVAGAYIIFTLARALCDVLDLINAAYEQRPVAAERPIKGYLQVGKILIYGASVILIVASLTGESPLLLLSGLGAMAAVLLLIFRDTILSLVASVQLRTGDMVRVGDWIDMPQLNADGDVIDIALHTVKVQNFDKTVTTIPTHKLISESYRNWRFMRQYGGRRIKRALHLDQGTIDFMDDQRWKAARRFQLLRPYIEDKDAELEEWNAKNASECGEPVNRRRPTNIGTFRAYVVAYLKSHPRISDRGTLLVRQLEPGEKGVPLEIYCFTDTVAWAEYEAIQSDIFDHLLAIVPEFGLQVFQQPSGHDVRAVGAGQAPGDAPRAAMADA